MADLILPDEGTDQQQQGKAATNLILPPAPDPVATANAREAAGVNPDAFAKAKKLSEQLALPLPTVERNIDSLDTEQKVRDMQARIARDPFYADRMRDPNFAKLSQGDEPQLMGVQGALQSLSSMGRAAVAGAIPDFAAATYGTIETGLKNIAPALDPLAGTILPVNPLRVAAAQFEQWRKTEEKFANAIAGPQTGGFVEQSVRSGFRSFGQMAPGLMAAILTRNPNYALAGGGMTQGSQSATKALDAGKSPQQALMYGVEDAVAEVVTEKIPMGVLIKDLGLGASFGKILLHQIATEVPTELAATAWQNMNEWANMNPQKTLKDYMAELGPAELQTVIATITTTVLTAGMGKVTHSALSALMQEKNATQDADTLKQLLAFSDASKLRERSPATFADFVNAATERGPVEAVYMDAATFAQAAQQAGVDLSTAMPETAAALPDAVATKSDVRIPLGEFAANSTLFQPEVVQHLKTDPNGATQAEIADKTWVENTKAQTEKVLAEGEFTDAWKASAANVKAELVSQLKAANRFTPDVNDAYAGFMSAFYATQSKRLGITPEEMYVKYPLRIQAQDVTGPNVLTQPAVLEDFAPGAVKDILQKDNWTILTAENPNAQQLTPEENAARMADLRAILDSRGIQYNEVQGKYGSEEHSLLVTGVTPQQALDLGRQFGQESVLTPQGLVYQDGSVNPATGVTEHATLPEDFYSVIPATGAKFTVDVNFDKKISLAEALGPKALASVPTYGRVTPNSISVTAVHFSPKPGLTFLSTGRYGQGMKDAAAARVNAHPDARMRQRLHFYVPQGNGVQAESGVGPFAYAVKLNNLYDADADVLHLAGGDTEVAVMNAGFDGYFTRKFGNKQGAVVLLNRHSVPVQALGNEREANAALGNTTTPAPVLSDARLLADALVQDKRLPSGQETPEQWKADIARLAPDLAAKLPDSIFAGTDPVYRDQLARPLYRAPSLFQQGEISSDWYYSELARQIDNLQVPKDGLTAAEWKKRVWEPASTKTVAIRDEKNKPTGETKTVEVAGKTPLVGVKPGEIEATGIIDWLTLRAEQEKNSEPGWVVVNPAGEAVQISIEEARAREYAAQLTDAGTATNILANGERLFDMLGGFEPFVVVKVHGALKNALRADGTFNIDAAEAAVEKAFEKARPQLRDEANQAFQRVAVAQLTFTKETTTGSVYSVRREDRRIDKQEVQEFLRDHGVRMDETILSADNEQQASEVEYNEGEWETDEPDEDWLAESAGERLDEYVQEKVDELMKEDDSLTEEQAREQIDEDAALEELIDRERQWYWDDSESPRSMSVEVTNGDESHSYNVHESYGEVYVSDERGNEVRVRGGDYEAAIREHAMEHYDMYSREGEAETQYQDYNPFENNGQGGSFGYVELLMTLPGKKLFTAPHFGDSGADRNLLAHSRVDFVVSDTETRPGDPNAKLTTMRVREIQADWAQQGREEGFVGKWYVTHSQNNERIVDAVFNTEAEAEAGRTALSEKNLEHPEHYSVGEGTINPAPFITSTDAWTSLVWKRLIRYAAENGADRVIWSRGDQQVEQWAGGLRKRVDRIEWTKTKEGVQLLGFKSEGHRGGELKVGTHAVDGVWHVFDSELGHDIGQDFESREAAQAYINRAANRRKVVDTTYAESALSDAIGKAMGKQILSDPAQSGVIEGNDITIDSVGMSQFYGDANGKKGDGNDAMLTKVANQVLKKLGEGKVQAFASGAGKVSYTYEGPNLSMAQLEDVLKTIVPSSAEGTMVRKAISVMESEPSTTFSDIVNRTVDRAPDRKGEVVSLLELPGIRGKLVKTESFNSNPGFEVTPALKAKALAGLPLFQGTRGQISFATDIKTQPTVMTLLANADLSTFLHESGHFYLEVLTDMAQQPDAHPEVVNDLNTLLKWFGVKDAEAWHALTMDEKRVYHEQFARGMESYLFEGKSPSLELHSLFGRFRAWLINVYQQITKLNVNLTPEVRQVFDRLVATNEEIIQAEQTRAFTPMFDTKPPGMSDAEWIDYQKTDPAATQEAVDLLQTRSLRDMQYASNAKATVLKRLQREAADKRKGVRAEVTAEVQAEPVYQVMHFIKSGIYEGESAGEYSRHKLDIPSLNEMYPADMPNRPDLSKLIPLTSKEGLHPDVIAEMFGIGSGDELVRKLLDAEPERQKIDGITDQRMLERYGDLADPASMEKAANAAVHNDVRAKFVATELRTLEKAVGNQRTLTTAAKEFAATLIARKKIRTIKPNVYAAAEAKAARNAQTALVKDDVVTAATEKRNQLVNLYAAKAANDAVSEVEKSVAYLKRIGESSTIDPAYRSQINALLERFDLRKTSAKDAARRASLVQWIEEQRAQNMEPVIDPALENEANRKPYADMTLEEFRGLVDSVRNIEHLGRLKHKLLTLADKRAFKVVVDAVSASIDANAKRTLPVQLESNTWTAKLKKGVAEWFAMHRKFAMMLREMDGFDDNGILQRILVHTSNAAGATEAIMHEAATVKLSELMKPLFAEGNLHKKAFIPAINAALSREGRIMVALNTGNEGNLQRLMDGEHWTMPQVQAVIDTLSKTDMDFVQGVWNFVGSYRDQIGAQQKRLTGLEPAWVEPRKVITKRGEYDGGYIPAKYDTARSTRSLSDEAAAGLMDAWRAKRGSAQTRASFTKERANKVVDRPLRKDFGVITQHITEVTHRLAWQEWLVDANRLLRAKPIDGAIREHYGPEVLQALRDTMEDIAAGTVPAQNAFERGINYLRTGATIAGLGWRLTTSLLQPIGLTQSMVRIGPKWVGKGLAEWLGDAAHMENTAKKIYDKSDFMRLRAKTMQREISEIRDQVSGKDSRIEASYFYLIQKMQLVADIPTWLGQYHKAIDGGANEATATAQADQAVIDAQGSGQIKDLAAIQRGGPMMKLFTNFYSFFNTTYNLTAEAVGRTDFHRPAQVGLLAVDFLLLYSVPAALGTLMKYALGDDDSDKNLIRNLIADQLGYMFGTMVGLREFAGVARTAVGLPGDYSGPASLRVFGAATALGKQIQQGEADESFWKALNGLAGILFHYPSGQLNSTADGIVAMSEGKTTNPGVIAVGSSKK